MIFARKVIQRYRLKVQKDRWKEGTQTRTVLRGKISQNLQQWGVVPLLDKSLPTKIH
jgi:hypothetical protein